MITLGAYLDGQWAEFIEVEREEQVEQAKNALLSIYTRATIYRKLDAGSVPSQFQHQVQHTR